MFAIHRSNMVLNQFDIVAVSQDRHVSQPHNNVRLFNLIILMIQMIIKLITSGQRRTGHTVFWAMPGGPVR
jgi:disulfide bond formation protein DsbB